MNNDSREISPADLSNLLRSDNNEQKPLLVDCREQEERELANIDKSVHLPMSNLPEGMEVLAGQEQAPIVVYCHHGIRSQNVAAWLTQQGFGNVRSLTGGIDAWAVEIEPGMVRY